ncbi:MAG: ribonuclease III [Paludibacteraceae bacterium]
MSFKQVLGFTPRKIELYQMAVRHRSVPLKNAEGRWVNNERLEFLGDAILNSIISDILYRRYEKEKEGFLTNARSNIVKRESLNKICCQIGLHKLIVADKQINMKENTNIYGNALEALVGAVYLDIGYEKCIKFVKKKLLISPESMKSIAEDNENYKSELFEWCQQSYLTLDYKLIEETLDGYNRHTFVSEVIIQEVPVCKGSGASKKESHQQASCHALEIIKNDEDFLRKLQHTASEKNTLPENLLL